MRVLLTYVPSEEHQRALAQVAPAAELLVADSEARARELIADADAVMGNRFFLQSLPAARRLRWMQSGSAGMDLVLSGGGRLHGIMITSVRGVYDEEVAEHGVALALALARRIHHARDAQRAREWPRWALAPLARRRALVVGWGGVGRGIARRLEALGLTVEGVRRRHAGPPVADGRVLVHGPETWRAALGACDVLVLALPLTPATRGLIGAAELAALPEGALVVNVGRGATLRTDALLAGLDAGHLGGAALDVLEEEPPAPDSPVWTHPNLLLTPHVARSHEAPPFRWEPLFVENLRRFVAGEPLLNVVDQEAGY